MMLHLFFRKDIPRCYALTRLPIPQDAIRDRATFRNRLGGIGAVADGFLRPGAARCAGKFGRCCGALVLLAVAKRGRAIDTGKVLRGAPWQIVIFSLGMYLVVYGLRNAGLTELLSGVLDELARQGCGRRRSAPAS